MVPQPTGTKKKVPQTFPCDDIRSRKKDERPTLGEIVDSWREITPTLHPDVASVFPVIPQLPPLLQRPPNSRTRRREERVEEQQEQVMEEPRKAEEQVVETPVKSPSLMSLTTSPGFNFKLDWTVLRPNVSGSTPSM